MRPVNSGRPLAVHERQHPTKSTNPTDADSLSPADRPGAVTGAILVDLTVVDPKVAYRRVAGLHMIPTGARLELVVGPLAVNPRVVRLVRTQLPRLSVRVLGEPYAVGRWVRALRDGDVLSDELPLGVTA
jgi:hypothetical protein